SKIAITETVQGTFTVTDNGVNIGAGTFTGITRDIRIIGSAADDTLTIDLGGKSVRNIAVQLGHGTNTLDIHNGSASFVAVNGGFFFSSFFTAPGGAANDTVSISGLHVAGSVG